MAVSKRTARTGMYPDEVERAAVTFLRSIHKAAETDPHRGRLLQGDPFRTAQKVLIHVGHQLYGHYPASIGPDGKQRTYRTPPKIVQRKVWDRDGWECRHCGTHVDLTVDHIIPVSKGGSDAMDNYQTLCRPCNSRKGAR